MSGLSDLVLEDIPSETGSHAMVCFMCDGRVNWEGAYTSTYGRMVNSGKLRIPKCAPSVTACLARVV